MEGTQARRARFAGFELDLQAGELRANGGSTLLPEQVFQVLRLLAERQGDVVTRDELKKKLWPNDTVVEFDHGINNTIKRLRKVLGDSPEEPKYIETIPRRGYRLMVPVEWVGPVDSATSQSLSSRADPESALGGRGGGEGPALDSLEEALPKARLQVGRLTGKIVSHYRVLEVIGGGGMGLVYRAEDLKLGRAVALKFLPEEVGDDPKARERFEREAHAVSALNHHNICTIYDFDEHEGHPFIAMELLKGKTLRDHLADGRFRLTQPEGLEVAIQIAAGLGAAHEKGIIHRDIKPANIFITEKGVAKILDFGVAKVMAIDAHESHSTQRWLSGAPEKPHPGNRSRDGAPAVDGARAEVVPDFSPANGDEKGRGFSRADEASLEDERGNQSPSGLIPPQDQINSPDGAPKGAPLQNSEEAADCRPEGVLHPSGAPAGALGPAKETTLTRTGMKLGTAGYMSPEQVRGEPLDARTDIFSFGLVLYEMATGERAFTGETEAIVHDAIQYREPKPIRELAPEISPELESIVGRCLEKQPERRYQTAVDLQNSLEQVQTTTVEEIKTPRERWKYAVAVTAVIAILAGGLYYQRIRNARKLTNTDTIVVADFENHTGDAVLDDALNTALTVELQQSPFLNLLAPDKIRATLKQMNLPETEKMTPAIALEVCRQTKSAVLVTGSIVDLGNRYKISLKATNCQTGKEWTKADVEADSRNQIVHALGEAGHRLRGKLGEPKASLRDFNQPLDIATSASVEALQAYTLGSREKERNGEAAAIPYLRRAVDLDPDFAKAHAVLAQMYANFGDGPTSRQSSKRAFDLRDRATQRDRFYIEGNYYGFVTGEVEKSTGAWRKLARAYPRDSVAHNNLSAYLREQGEYRNSIAEARESLRINPDNYAPYYNLMRSEMAMEQPEEAKAAYDEARSRNVDTVLLRDARYLLAFLQRDEAAMQEQVTWAEGKPGAAPLLGAQSVTETYFGRRAKARELAQRAMQAARRDNTEDMAAYWIASEALVEADIGNLHRADELMGHLVWLDKGQNIQVPVAMTMARVNRVTEAEDVAAHLSQQFPLSTGVSTVSLPSIRAAIELERGNPGGAITALQPEARLGYFTPLPLLYPAYLRGLAYLQLAEPLKAQTEFQKIIDHPGIVVNSLIGALAHLQLARAQVMMGDKNAARKSYQDFLTLWKDADPDIPIYRQAKAEYAKLK